MVWLLILLHFNRTSNNLPILPAGDSHGLNARLHQFFVFINFLSFLYLLTFLGERPTAPLTSDTLSCSSDPNPGRLLRSTQSLHFESPEDGGRWG